MNATNAKAYDKKTAAFIGFLVQNVPEISDESMNFWIDNPESLKKELRGLNIKLQKVRQSFRFRTTDAVITDLDAIPGKKTRLCFSGSLYSYRADNINYLLPENQLRTEGCFIQALILPKRVEATFVELATAFLNVSRDTPVRTLGNFLKARGHTMTLPQIEKMVEITERGLVTGMDMDSDEANNFFFLENRELKISVGRIYRDKSGWAVKLFNFEDGHQWPNSSRLLVRNLYLK